MKREVCNPPDIFIASPDNRFSIAATSDLELNVLLAEESITECQQNQAKCATSLHCLEESGIEKSLA
jgi:hypothetical protein